MDSCMGDHISQHFQSPIDKTNHSDWFLDHHSWAHTTFDWYGFPYLCSFTKLIKLIRILIKWKYIQEKIMPFWPLCCKSKAILWKKFSLSHQEWVCYSIMGKVSSWLLISWSQKLRSQYPGKRCFPYQHIKVFTKQRVVRWDLRNRASPVDWALMKRLLFEVSLCSKLDGKLNELLQI